MTLDYTSIVIGSSIAITFLSVIMVGFSLWNGVLEDTLLFPVTILSVSVLITISVLATGYTSTVLLAVAGAILVDTGCTIVYFQKLINQ